jgi:ABC-2 type transport system ATP-binding protein
LLILDEPTTGLDPIGTRQIKDLILKLREAGKTVLLCSHLLADVEDVTDRAAIMFGGKVRRAGTIEELLANHDELTITTSAVGRISDEELIQLLESRGIDDVRVQRSRQKLESLFLEIVHQAQSEGLATAGAGNAGGVAAFLTQRDQDAGTLDSAAASEGSVLDSLVQTESSPTPTQKMKESSEGNVEQAEQSAPVPDPVKPAAHADRDVLADLSGQAPATKPSQTSTTSATPTPQPDPPSPSKPAQADRSVLDDLLNNDGKG